MLNCCASQLLCRVPNLCRAPRQDLFISWTTKPRNCYPCCGVFWQPTSAGKRSQWSRLVGGARQGRGDAGLANFTVRRPLRHTRYATAR